MTAAATAETADPAFGDHVKRLFWALVVGVIFVIASVPDGTALLARQEGWRWLTGPAEASAWLKSMLPPVPSLLDWIVYALIAYGAALLLLSMRHLRPSLLAWGVGILAGSACLLHGLAWVGVLVFVMGRFVARVFGAVARFVAGIFVWVGEKLKGGATSVVDLFEPFMGKWAWAGPLLTVVLVLGLLHLLGVKWARTAAVVAFWIAVVLGFFAALGWLISLVPQEFWTAAGTVIGWILLFLVVLFALVTVGALVIDQLMSSKHAGSDRIGVVMGAIAIGSTLAVLMLVGNVYGVYGFYPDMIRDWAAATVLSDAPKFDAAMTLLVVSLCCLGVLGNLGRMRPEPDLLEFRRSLIFTIMGMITAGAIASLDKATSE